MQVGYIYRITIGVYSDMYAAVSSTPLGITLRRVLTPKTKIDAKRLPEHLFIEQFGQPLKQLK